MAADFKQELLHYLQQARDVMLWKLDGLSEYDARRPLTPTGTNLLGLVKHLAGVELGYFGLTFDRPPPVPPPWDDGDDAFADMWATATQSRAEIVELYRSAWRHSDETIAALELDAVGRVPWWPAERREVSLHRVLVHVATETHRHAGHADIVRELVDGAAGHRAEHSNIPDDEAAQWAAYRDKVEQAARQASADDSPAAAT